MLKNLKTVNLYLNEDTTIDWQKEYDVYALNLNTHLFEAISTFTKDKKCVIVFTYSFYTKIFDANHENDISNLMCNPNFGINRYCLYDNNNILVGFVYSQIIK